MDEIRWIVYLIRCSDESLYCGITNNLKNRLEAHNSGKGSKYTRFRRPVELVAVSPEITKSDALKLEYRVKQLPASKKYLELTKEENKMTRNIKKDLQAVNKELKALVKKTESLLKAVDKLEKPKVLKKPKAKPAKTKAPMKAAVKKAAPVTTADTVLAIIKRYKKGVGTAALMEKTGYNQKKIFNLVFKLRKQGKIKSVGKGVYLKA
ncbi:MAG: GIY-YIG nuclease family protein [Deltaproteobacteria bacterium]|nr:GIY-YIG nuclease family protein [Deltaproteobacteria bacterium]